MKPKVSLIIPVYKMEQYISYTLDSIINQTFKEFEVIVVDDGSPDNSGKIADEYSNKDERIKVVHQENKGAGPARNVGIELAQGEYLMFPDADDILESTMIETMIKKLEEKNVDVIMCSTSDMVEKNNGKIEKIKYSRNEIFLKNKEELRDNYIDLYIESLSHGTNTKMYKANIVNKYNIRFPDLRRSQDIIFNNRYFDKADSFLLIPDVLYNYRVSEHNLFVSKLPQNIFDIIITLNNDIISLLKKWDKFDKNIENRLAIKLLLNLAVYIPCINRDNVGNIFKRRKYIKNILVIPEIQQAANIVETKTLFVNIYKKAIMMKAAILVELICKSKLFILNKFPKVFGVIKSTLFNEQKSTN